MYAAGKYRGAPPLPFVATILATLGEHPAVRAGRGLYLGCGNGRNYLPLRRAGLDLVGLDISAVALADLRTRLPAGDDCLVHADLQTFCPDRAFDYVIALQVLQHGAQEDVEAHFARVAALLEPGGLFFLRVNSTNAEIFFQHHLRDTNAFGGFSVECTEGAKTGQPVHFYTREEILALAAPAFRVLAAPSEMTEFRLPPRTGSWAQWETILQRR